MRFKIDDNLEVVTTAMVETKDPKTVAHELCECFINDGMIDMAPANFNVHVIQATGPQHVFDVCAVLAEYLYKDEFHAIPADVFDAFCKLVIVPDGCPYCGGELRFIETEGHELNDGDYYTPNSYIIDNYVYRCRECGETIKSEKEL